MPEGVEADDIDRTGWFSYYAQYSDPEIHWHPGTSFEPVYAQCIIKATGENTEEGTIQMAQYPGSGTAFRYNLTGMDVDTEYGIRVNVLGTLGTDCAKVGGEFNPLAEINQWGMWNPTQDPTRGRVIPVTSDDLGLIDMTEEKPILVNLSGHASIVGRSLNFYAGKDETPRACCTIGEIADPDAVKEEVEPVAEEPKPQPAYHPGYGYYNYGGYSPNPYYHGGYSQQY